MTFRNLFIASTLLLANFASANNLRGKVFNNDSTPISGVRLHLKNLKDSSLTNIDGVFQFGIYSSGIQTSSSGTIVNTQPSIKNWKLIQNGQNTTLILSTPELVKAKLFSSQGKLINSWSKYVQQGEFEINLSAAFQKTFLRVDIAGQTKLYSLIDGQLSGRIQTIQSAKLKKLTRLALADSLELSIDGTYMFTVPVANDLDSLDIYAIHREYKVAVAGTPDSVQLLVHKPTGGYSTHQMTLKGLDYTFSKWYAWSAGNSNIVIEAKAYKNGFQSGLDSTYLLLNNNVSNINFSNLDVTLSSSETGSSSSSSSYCDINPLECFEDPRDKQQYRKTTIGNQVWMAENLNYDTANGSYCYNNDESNCDTYGRLYTWTTIMSGEDSSSTEPSGVTGICPLGWHLPSDLEWETMASYVAGHSGLNAKTGDDWDQIGFQLKADTTWINASNGTDNYGFTALAAGNRIVSGSFGSQGTFGNWWSTTETGTHAYIRYIGYLGDSFNRSTHDRSKANSVRCVQAINTLPIVYPVEFSIPGGTFYNAQIVSLSSITEGVSIFYTTDGSEPSISSTPYTAPIAVDSNQTVRAIALKNGWTNSSLTNATYSFYNSFTDSRDGQTYKITTIGSQTWMSENLNYDIGAGSYCSNNLTANCDTYGRLYRWDIALDGSQSSSTTPSGIQGVCPVGWHLPSSMEWETMAAFIANDAGLTEKTDDDWTQIGAVMKSDSTWLNDGNGTDNYGFTGLGGGWRYGQGSYLTPGQAGAWWSSTEDSTSTPYGVFLHSNSPQFGKSSNSSYTDAFSIRCLKDPIITPIVKDPTLNIASGTYTSSQKVTIQSETPEATIYYTLDGSIPDSSSNLYSDTLNIDHDLTLKAIAYKAGWTKSSIISAQFKIGSSLAPTFSLQNGTYRGARKLAINTSTPGADIYYRIEGFYPTANWLLYTDSIYLDQNATVKAIAFKSGMGASDTAVASYKFEHFFVDSRDNEEYRYVEIGDQRWMAENLRYDPSPKGYPDHTGHTRLAIQSGRLYAHWLITDNAVGGDICPTGWHIPSENEWDKLTDHVQDNRLLYPRSSLAPSLKKDSIWYRDNLSNYDFVNLYGFSVLPGGWRADYNGNINGVDNYAYFWTSTEALPDYFHARRFLIQDTYVRDTTMHLNDWMSLRCVGNLAVDTSLSSHAGTSDFVPCFSLEENEFCDTRSGMAYDSVTIGTQTWMAQNLNFATDSSYCYSGVPSNCDAYGQLYKWEDAMGDDTVSTSNPSGVQGVCPSGWHLPSEQEWRLLGNYTVNSLGLNGESDSTWWDAAGRRLKATEGWNTGSSGLDIYNFNALPGGFSQKGNKDFINYNGGISAYWWSTTDQSTIVNGYDTTLSFGYTIGSLNYSFGRVSKNKDSTLLSVRCLKDTLINSIPYANNLNLHRLAAKQGDTLNGHYNYKDYDGDTEGTTSFRWLRDGVEIPNATDQSYMIQHADSGKIISFEVTPRSVGDSNTLGFTVKTSLKNEIYGFNFPTASNLSISGTPFKDSILKGSYTYDDQDNDLEGGTSFRWLRDGVTISGATTTNYVVTREDFGKNLTFEVTPQALTGDNIIGASVVSSSSYIPNPSAEFRDERDNQTYQFVQMGDQVWMAENLNYDFSRTCYQGREELCEQYGGIYTWYTASGQDFCPAGWHLPNNTEWEEMANFVADSTGLTTKSGNDWIKIGPKLKGKTTWIVGGNGSDDFSFNALAGGTKTASNSYVFMGDYGYWWTKSSASTYNAYARSLKTDNSALSLLSQDKDYKKSVRCIRDISPLPYVTDVLISGSTNQGGELQASYKFHDPENDEESGTTFRWLRDGASIAGETTMSYQIQYADSGKVISFEVTPRTASGNFSEGIPVASTPSDTVYGFNAPVANSVSITGAPHEGDTLRGHYIYSDIEGDLEGNSEYKWYRDGVEVSNPLDSIYPIQYADSGKVITFGVTPKALTGHNLEGIEELSSPAAAVTGFKAPYLQNVKLTGNAAEDQELTASYIYRESHGDEESGTTYRWLRDSVEVPEVTGLTYPIQYIDSGKVITFEIVPRDTTGLQGDTVRVSTAPVWGWAAPYVQFVKITGNTEEGDTLTGSYVFYDRPVDIDISTFRWLRDGEFILDATDITYTLTPADVGKEIRFEVTPKTPTGVNTLGLPVTSDSIIGVYSHRVVENGLTDSRDGQSYNITYIGQDVWMAQNMAYLPQVDSSNLGSGSDPFYYVYDYSPTGEDENTEIINAKATENFNTYGVLYNWSAAMGGASASDLVPSGIKGICPSNWHLPSDQEWENLAKYIANKTGLSYKTRNDWNDIGKKMKDTTGWVRKTGIDNIFGFSAVPAGYRNSSGGFNLETLATFLWSTSTDDYSRPYIRNFDNNLNRFGRSFESSLSGYSVRCIKD